MNETRKWIGYLLGGIGTVGFLILMGAATITLDYGRETEMRCVSVALTSDGSGDANGAVSAALVKSGGSGAPVAGLLYRVVTNPGDGTTSPTDAWDLVVNDGDGVDMLAAAGANRSQSLSQQITPNPPIGFAGGLTVVGSNMGGTKQATVRLYFR